MFISIIEIIYLIILIFVVGYVFSDIVKRPSKEDILLRTKSLFSLKNLKYATLIAAPGIVLHELAHKFVAIGFGLNADFNIWIPGIVIAVLLKILNTGFLLLAPGYVAISGASAFQSTIIAFAGPLMNALIWVSCLLYLKYTKRINRDIAIRLSYMGHINKWLFLFNMIPIPPLDGFTVAYYLFSLI